MKTGAYDWPDTASGKRVELWARTGGPEQVVVARLGDIEEGVDNIYRAAKKPLLWMTGQLEYWEVKMLDALVEILSHREKYEGIGPECYQKAVDLGKAILAQGRAHPKGYIMVLPDLLHK